MDANVNATSGSSLGSMHIPIVPGLNFTDPAKEGPDNQNMNMDMLSKICSAHPNNATAGGRCLTGFYGYVLDFRANTAFTALFVTVLMAYIIAWCTKRRARDFTLAMVLGCLCEVLGYSGRTWSQQDQLESNPFFLQICCLTIGPAFMAAGLYLCLRRIVQCFGPHHSRIAPEWYTRLFIPCDIVSLILQGVGGGLAAHAFKHADKRALKFGDNVMLAGLAFQVFTMFLFVLASLDFAVRVLRRYRAQGAQALDQTASIAAVRRSTPFKLFLCALGFATACIFIRCAFRVAELSGGWEGPLMENQALFIVFEGVMILLAAAALAIFNPCFCFKQMSVGTSRVSFGKI